MNIRKIRDIVIYRDEDYYCGPGPAAVAFADGEVVVLFRRHRSWTQTPLFTHVHPTTEMCLVRSTDGGETWTRPRVFQGGGQCAGAGLLKDGTALFTTHRVEVVPPEIAGEAETPDLANVPNLLRRRPHAWSAVAAGTEFWRSEDRCETWDGPYWVGEVPGLPIKVQGLHTPVQHRAFPVELRDGSIAMTVQGRGIGSILVVSEDRGRTWNFRSVAAPVPKDGPEQAFNEWTLRETPAGDLVGFIRCALPLEKGGRFLWTVRSSDRGHTWTEPKREEVWGHPYYPLPLSSGHALLVNGYRREPYGIRCRILGPECDNISEAEEFVLREDGGAADLGYPHAALMPDGRILVLYYFNTGGQRYVAGTIVAIE